ncbi:LysR family transcriptional regulator [Rubrobacter marinus]|uniref:LysR family transcriptional regulator n=1 Tax=Rubrobacter marinus TaxID=2653852 RepID=A0A6G8Q0H8_9ACTN|nr:LysR substrate-binding domain-containing protein [Rubrobacter marinus]QIN79972.1 LysR family transcriptional regulator [Rubrobacter marinus]
MELRHLRYFVAVAEELSFSRAAQRLHMAQPPLSTQIKQLEQEIGARLFDRTGRSVQLTEAGRLFLQEVRRIFVQVEQASRMAREADQGELGRLSLGFIPAASNDLLPEVLREFRRRFPKVELYMHELMPDRVVQSLHDRRVDVSFLFLPCEDQDVPCKVVSREPLVVALPETHPLASEPKLEMRDLANEDFVLPARYSTPSLYGKIVEVCHRSGFLPNAVQEEVGLMQTVLGVVAGGLGIALVPASLRNLNRRGVVYKELRNPEAVVEMGVVWRRGDNSPVLASFLRVVGEVSERKIKEQAEPENRLEQPHNVSQG